MLLRGSGRHRRDYPSGFGANAGTTLPTTCFVAIMSDRASFIVITALSTSYTVAFLTAVAMRAL
jgi:hypothetical protein